MNDKFDDIIARLQSQQPVLDNADELTDAIMSALPDQQTASAPVVSHIPRVFYLLRNVSSAAAVFLIALFVWQYNEQPELSPNGAAQTNYPSNGPSFSCNCFSQKECVAEYISQHNRNENTRANIINLLIRVQHENY